MSGFIRRYESLPDLATIRAIEGVVIIDQDPPNVPTGRLSGTLALVGEWPKGPVNTPTLVEGNRTLQDVFGGFQLSCLNPLSYSAGVFTNPYSNGNAFCWLAKKAFRRLVLVRPDLNLLSKVKVQLRTVSGGSVVAVGVGQLTFATGLASGDGDVFTPIDARGTSVTFEINKTGSVTLGNVAVPVTDAMTASEVRDSFLTVLQATTGLAITGVAGGAGVADLYQNYTGTSGNTTITETGTAIAAFTSFVNGTGGSNVLAKLAQNVRVPAGTRVYDASATDRTFGLSGDVTFLAGTHLGIVGFTNFDADLSGFSTRTVAAVPVYSVKNTSEGAVGDVDTVSAVDLFNAGIGVNAALPNYGATAATGALDGAAANATALTVLSSTEIDTAYVNAIRSSLPGDEVSDIIEILACARQSDTIRDEMRDNVVQSSAVGTGRIALLRPPIGTTRTTAVSSSDPGVADRRSDRLIYCFPHFEQRIEQLAVLDALEEISSSNILLGADAAAGHIISTLNPELNPGQRTGRLTYIRKLEDGLTTAGQPTKFTLDDYTAFKAAGIFALRRDPRIAEWVFQSGVTSVDPAYFSAKAPIKRRRMADYIQDNLANIGLSYSKQSNRPDIVDSFLGDVVSYLESLLSRSNASQQRIADYSLDAQSANTPALQGTGVFIVLTRVQLLDSLDHIVFQTTIGETVSTVIAEV